jgi:hypothetical protein
MKKTYKFIYSAAVVAALALTASSCTESMDTEPQGSTLTKEELERNASSLDGLVKGMYSNMIEAEAITSWVGATRHYDFGYASTMMMMDNAGQDEVSPNSRLTTGTATTCASTTARTRAISLTSFGTSSIRTFLRPTPSFLLQKVLTKTTVQLLPLVARLWPCVPSAI